MEIPQLLLGLFIHLVVPISGIILFLSLRKKAIKLGASGGFLLVLSFIFCAYGGWVMLALTALFWRWSFMASVGSLFLFAVFPIVAIALLFYFRKSRELSPMHYWAFWANLLLIPPIILPLAFVLAHVWEMVRIPFLPEIIRFLNP